MIRLCHDEEWKYIGRSCLVEIEKTVVELIGGKIQKCPWTEAKRRVFRTKDEEKFGKNSPRKNNPKKWYR